VSPKANELDEAVRSQDQLLVRALLDRVPRRFLVAMLKVRNDLVKDLAQEWRKAS
jgi:hypothetical protein